jgi:asparagine synthase (glutamine-hydrolysing)
MCGTILHRGPDEGASVVRGTVGLGARRLSIIDLAGGSQPLYNEDRSVCVVFNGEIYNYRELRRELQQQGHTLSSETDGEVIAHLWEQHGTGLLDRLNGMFAFALHDASQKRLLLARDRVGIKPLYWAATAGGLVFGSEVKTVLASGLVDRGVDLDALGQFMAWEYVPAPATLLRSVRKLAPAELMEVDLDSGERSIRRWWDVPAPARSQDDPAGEADWEDALDAKLRECVRRQLVSDVPLGAFLSGGVDSSLVTAAMDGARTFSIGFDDPSYNELEWSRRVARHLGLEHRTEVIEPDVRDLFDRLMHFMDDPIGDFSIFPTYLVSRLAREDVTVVLSGDGGDELFGGYETYLAQERARQWARLPRALRGGLIEPAVRGLRPRAAKKGLVNKARRFVEGLGHDERLRHARWRLFLGEALREELFTAEALEQMPTPAGAHLLDLFERAGERDELDACLYVDLNSYLSDNCLVKVDRMSMACSLEARVPFLDHELVELAFRVPTRLKLAGGETKALLKRVAARHVPRECVYRPKEGFSIPIKHWLGTSLRALMDERLDPERLRAEGVFDADTVSRLVREHLDSRENHSHLLWSLIVFQEWRERWAA